MMNLDENRTEFQNFTSLQMLGIYNKIHEILVGPNHLGHVIGDDNVWLKSIWGHLLIPVQRMDFYLGCFWTPRR